MNLFLWYPRCSTSQKAKRWLDLNGISYLERNIAEDNPSYEELYRWIKISALPVKKFFNTSGLVYKSLGIKDKLPNMSDADQIKLLSTNGMLVKRPIFVGSDVVLVGFKEQEWEKLKS